MCLNEGCAREETTPVFLGGGMDTHAAPFYFCTRIAFSRRLFFLGEGQSWGRTEQRRHAEEFDVEVLMEGLAGAVKA